MRIIMLATTPGTDDGYTYRTYEKGKVYTVSESLGRCFVDDGKAEEYEEKVVLKAPENKDAGDPNPGDNPDPDPDPEPEYVLEPTPQPQRGKHRRK